MSALRVEVRAQPKAGFRDSGAGAYGDDGTPLVRPGFERVNYRDLHGIVVWAEPLAPARDSADESRRAASTRVELPLSIRSDDGSTPVIALPLGGECVVLNDLNAAESIFSVGSSNPFDLGAIPSGGRSTFRAARAGVFELLSDAREKPIALVFVAPAAWARSTRAGSAVVLMDLPPGRCRVHAWHERFPECATEVDLAADKAKAVELTIGVNQLPKASP